MLYADKMFNDFRNQGYKYFIILKGARSKVLFTKAEINDSLFGDLFNDDDEFDEFKLTEDIEKAIFKVFPRNTLINILN